LNVDWTGVVTKFLATFIFCLVIEFNIPIFNSYQSDEELYENFLMTSICCFIRTLGKNVSKYCISTKHNSRAPYYVTKVSFLPQKFSGLYPVRCDYWLYQIVKFEYGLAFSGVTFIPEFAKKVNWLNGIRKQTHGEEMAIYLTCIFARRKEG
jgi:hypothetical protein